MPWSTMTIEDEKISFVADVLALREVLREEQEALCGPAHKKGSPDDPKRWGTAKGRLAFGGQRIAVERPRVRKCSKEMKLPSWEEFAAEDPLDDTTYKQMVLGVSTRNYERSLDELLTLRFTSESAGLIEFKAWHSQDPEGDHPEALALPLTILGGPPRSTRSASGHPRGTTRSTRSASDRPRWTT